ncbi:MAG: TIGR04290 family methyltransferase [Solirubrobacterales bacterium]
MSTRSPRTLERNLSHPRTALEREVAALGPWFHNLHLPGGLQTAPEHPLGDFPMCKWKCMAPHLPEDLAGRSVLDIGCNAGFYSFELARRGAQVTAVDTGERYLRQAAWAADKLGLRDRIRFEQVDVYDLMSLGRTFDLVLFLGVFYHLRHPLLGLDIVSSITSTTLFFQTLTMPQHGRMKCPQNITLAEREQMLDTAWPKMAFIERSLEGDPTNWWVPNHAAVEAMLRSCGWRSIRYLGEEIYRCENRVKRVLSTISRTMCPATVERHPNAPRA